MEASQSYYLYKDSLRRKQMSSSVETRKSKIRGIAISWLIEALKTVLGYEDIRNKIVKYVKPELENQEHMRTFDAFQQYETPPFLDKTVEIIDYCEEIIEDKRIKGKVLMTASNIQESADDMLTHYQTFIINKDTKHVYSVDPAHKKKGKGIYDPSVSRTVVFPIFRSYGYTCQYVPLRHPAQTNKNDVFCQTWSLLIGLNVLDNYDNFDIVEIPCPREKVKKYQMLLDFYKKMIVIPGIQHDIEHAYIELVTLNKKYISKHCPFQSVVSINSYDLLESMTVEDML
jgi:hypothetical protein